MMFIQRFIPGLAVLVLFFGLTGLALSQGQIIKTVLPTPTPMALPPDATPPSDPLSAAALPDLIVTKIETQRSPPLAGSSTRILVTIKNQGSGAVSCDPANNFNTDLYIDPPVDPFVNYHQIVSNTLNLPWGVQCFWTPSGGSYVLETTWVFTDVGTFDVWAQVDSDGNVIETNEDNNTQKVSVNVTTAGKFFQDTHQDFLTHMASTLDDDDPEGKLRLSRFQEPPFFNRPFTDAFCDITPASMVISDVNITSPDMRINPVITEDQISPQLFANGQGVVVAVWEDWRNGPVNNRDIYLRYSTDEGETWQPEIKVNDGLEAPLTNQTNPSVALSQNGTMMVAWQDKRNDNWDVYAQEFELSGALAKVGNNFLIGGAASYNAGDQIFPDVAVDENGGFHFAWEDKRNGNSDIFATSYVTKSGTLTWTNVRRIDDGTGNTQQARPQIDALEWSKITSIDYTVAPVEPYTVTINNVISEPVTILVATWEDDRNGGTDIAMTVSIDGGETFDVDQLLTNSLVNGSQQKPDVTLTKDIATVNVTIPITNNQGYQEEVEVPVSDIHVVWEGYNTPDNLDRDIYYSKSRLSVTQNGSQNEFEPDFSVGGSEKINQNDLRDWQTGPVDQSSPALTAVQCPGTESTGYNVFIAWADGRNYDDLNYDIYYDLKSTCGASLESNQLLANGVGLHNFDTDNPSYSDYDRGHPPPGRQSNPGIAADIKFEGSTVSGGYLYLAWEDDRVGNPQQNKDIYFARSNLTFYNQTPYGFPDGAGSHISNILDSDSISTTWYTLAWDVTTPESTYVTVQTRLGNTITDVLDSDWYPQGFPFQPQPGACDFGDAFDSGAPLPGYDAPGQHIEDSSGQYWPQARYIQYRVNFYTRDETQTPELDSLTLYYDGQSIADNKNNNTYLPIIMK